MQKGKFKILIFTAILSVNCVNSCTQPVKENNILPIDRGINTSGKSENKIDKNISKVVAKPSYREVIIIIAEEIERIKNDYEQLAEFSKGKHCDPDELKISYSYKTHLSKRRGGWTSSVPNPDDDGIWFYIDLHDPESKRQIHTQPITVPLFYGDKRMMYLILEGKHTKKISKTLYKIMQNNGVTTNM